MNNLLEESDITPITIGTSLRYQEDDRIVYEFKWLKDKEKFDTKSLTTEHKFTHLGNIYCLNKKSVDKLSDELVQHMKASKFGKYYEPNYKEFYTTLLVYFLTWEGIAALCWYLWWRDSWKLLFSLPVLFVLLAIVSILDEVSTKRKDSYLVPTMKLREFERSFQENNVQVVVERTYQYLKIKVKKRQDDNVFADVKPIVPYTPGIGSSGKFRSGSGLNDLKLPGDSPVDAQKDAKAKGGMNYPEGNN